MQRVFITGASSGIGAALALAYARQGACVALVGRRLPALQAVLASLPGTAPHCLYALDVNDYLALTQAARAFSALHDGIDVVIASAGISHGTLTEVLEDQPVFEQIVATNLHATVATFAPFIAIMKQQMANGTTPYPLRLVGIGSVAGIRGLPGAAAYSASKAALISYCESLRVELRGTGIRVVTIVPGYIATPMTHSNHYRMPFLMPVARFAERAVAAITAGTSYRVIPWQMGWVARLLRSLPIAVYDWAMAKAPRKARATARDVLPRL